MATESKPGTRMETYTEPAAVLIAAQELIHDPFAWIQAGYAADDDSNDVLPTDPTACGWCAHGAIEAVSATPLATARATESLRKSIDTLYGPPTFLKLLIRVRDFFRPRVSPREHITRFNDEPYRTHGEVMAAFSHAIGREMTVIEQRHA